MTAPSVLGLDIGGSTSRAALRIGDGKVGTAAGSSASLVATAPGVAETVVRRLLEDLELRADGPGLDAVCAGSAGSGSAEAAEQVTGWLLPFVRDHDPARVLVVNDSRLPLAAEGFSSGIAVVAGTGSTASGVLGGREERAGGWGYLLGDAGSGYWITREAIRELCRRADEHEPLGALGTLIPEALGKRPESLRDEPTILDLIAEFHGDPHPGRWAALAPSVLSLSGADSVAGHIALAAASALGDLAFAVAGRLGHPAPVPVVLAGGLLGASSPLTSLTTREISGRLPQAAVRTATRPPVLGALALAHDLAKRMSRPTGADSPGAR